MYHYLYENKHTMLESNLILSKDKTGSSLEKLLSFASDVLENKLKKENNYIGNPTYCYLF